MRSKMTCALLMVTMLSTAILGANQSIREQAQASVLAPTAPPKELQALLIEKYLIEGKLSDGEEMLRRALTADPQNDQLRFSLGFVQFVRAIEVLVQDLYKFGLRDVDSRDLFLPVPQNPAPKTLAYKDARKIVDTFRSGLSGADSTLSAITDANVKMPLPFGLIKLDLNRDNAASDNETLWRLYASTSRNSRITAEKAKQFRIAFDNGDVHWLRGYCNLLQAVCEILLAYDFRETFDCTAHLFFKKVDSPYSYLSTGKTNFEFSDSDRSVLDLVALIHTLRWNVVEPKRMEAALNHLETVAAQSRLTWAAIASETDNDSEWLPNPQQTGVIPNVRVSKEMIASWSEIMNQVDLILKGKLLIKFWRGDDKTLGINLRQAFLKPTTFDLVLWVQGSAAKPYLEHGDTTSGAKWRDLINVYGGNFPGFAAWFN